MKNRGFLLIVAFYIALLLLSYDMKIIKFIEGFRNGFFDYIFLGFSLASNILVIFFLLTAIFLWKEHKRRWIFPLWLSGFLAIITSFILKIIIHRPRPFEKGVSTLSILFYFMRNSFQTWDFSFPSMHAFLVFSALPIINKEFKKFSYLWLIFACLAAFSRVYFGLHYFSDILLGALFGYLTGYLIIIIEEKYEIGKRIIRKLKLGY